ncbi:MAG: FkbM family methyltransferase, partial [Phycisphaerales bacterium]
MQAYLLDNSKVEIDPMSAEIGGSWQAPRRDGIPDVWGADELRFFYKRTLERRRPVVIDVGANTGSYSLLAAINRDMASYAFEPAPITYAVLNKNISLNNLEARVKAFNMALADRNGKGVLKYPESGKESGLACIGRPLRFDRWIEYEVDLWRLDDFAAQNGIEKADLIKLDTEGSELLVLKGAEEFVRRCRPNIFCEYHEVNAGQFGYHPRQIVELLHSWGYRHARVGHEDVYFYIPKGTGVVMPGFKKGDACDRPAVDHSVPAVCAERGRRLPKVAIVKQVLDVFGP